MPIIIGSMADINIPCDEKWFLMDNMEWFYLDKNKNIIKDKYALLMKWGTKVMKELAPPSEIFIYKMRKIKMHTFNKECFDTVYAPGYIKAIKNSNEAREALNQLWYLDKKLHKTVVLIGIEKNEELCHRCILAGFLLRTGCNVISSQNRDMTKYLKYYDMYKNA